MRKGGGASLAAGPTDRDGRLAKNPRVVSGCAAKVVCAMNAVTPTITAMKQNYVADFRHPGQRHRGLVRLSL